MAKRPASISSCEFCGLVGVSTPFSHKIERNGQSIESLGEAFDSLRVYNLGNNDTTNDDQNASERMLERYVANKNELMPLWNYLYNDTFFFVFRYSAKIFNMEERYYEKGSIGKVTIPKIWTSNHSDVVELSEYENTAKRRRHLGDSANRPPTTESSLSQKLGHAHGDKAERMFFEVLKQYFGGCNEDVLILVNQNITNPSTLNQFERDFMVVNLTSGYILNVEAKASLKRSSLDGPNGGKNQLYVSQNLLKRMFQRRISKDWYFIGALFGLRLHPEIEACANCQRYLLIPRDIFKCLDEILPKPNLRRFNRSWITDFRNISKKLIFEGVKINDDLISRICAASERAGTAENIAFWSPEQYDILSERNKRVLLYSSNSTGKTILMLYMMKKLLENGEEVSFLIYQHQDRTGKSLLQLKIQEMFQHYLANGKLQLDRVTGNYQSIFFRDYKKRNLFVDELFILFDPYRRNLRTRPSIEYLLHRWDTDHNIDKFLWIAVAGIDERMSFDEFKQTRSSFQVPMMTYPLRNTKEILLKVNTLQEQSATPGLSDLDVGPRGNRVKTYWNISIPENLTNTIEPKSLANYAASSGIRQAFEIITQNTLRENPKALIIMGTEVIKDLMWRGGYSQICDIFREAGRPVPILYTFLRESEQREKVISNWMTKPGDRRCDLVVDYSTSHGCENDIVIFMQRKNCLIPPNSLLRAKSVLVIITFVDLK